MARRLTDIVLGLAGLAVAAPVLVAIAAAVRLREGAPVIYRARRVGQHGREFQLFKFRTMVPAGGSSVTVWADPRVTPLGRRLRRLKLDRAAAAVQRPARRDEHRGSPPGEAPPDERDEPHGGPPRESQRLAGCQSVAHHVALGTRERCQRAQNGKGLPCSSSSRSTLRRTIAHAARRLRETRHLILRDAMGITTASPESASPMKML